MDRRVRFRTGALLVIVLLIIGFYMVRLYKLQLVDVQESDILSDNTYTYYTTITASRGAFLDTNGKPLVSNRASYNLSLSYYVLMNSEDPNGSLQKLSEQSAALGVQITDHLPVSTTRPYAFDESLVNSVYKNYFEGWKEQRKVDPDISAEQLIRSLADRYNLPEDLSDEMTRTMVGMRYELELRRYFSNLEDYVVAYDVPAEYLADVLDLTIPGLSVLTSTERVYETTYCAHILGTVGLMNAEEYEYYKELGYPMNAVVGKDGLELAFEEYLHGTDGLMKTTVTSTGEIVEQVYVREPIPGGNVTLTIDLELQMAAEDALAEVIEDLKLNGLGTSGEGRDAQGGAVVVQDVNTGAVLACGSYPTFDLSSYFTNFNELSADKDAPLFNRALLAPYPPGSIFKMATTIAMIDEGGVGRFYEIQDHGVYTFYEGTELRCLYWKNTGWTHGSINVMQALSVSCNYFFYEAGRVIGIDPIDSVAKALGLGEKTGVELYEETGTRANPATKAEAYKNDPSQSGWYGVDTLVAAIGQSEHRYTPMQMCSYTSALANGGTRYSATFLKRVSTADYSENLVVNEPKVASRLEISEEAMAAVSEGMVMAAKEGTAMNYLWDYPIPVACKTGTAEHGSGGSDHASFVLYAPVENPQISIAVYVEKGAQGGNLANVAKAIMDVYFARAEGPVQQPPENAIG